MVCIYIFFLKQTLHLIATLVVIQFLKNCAPHHTRLSYQHERVGGWEWQLQVFPPVGSGVWTFLGELNVTKCPSGQSEDRAPYICAHTCIHTHTWWPVISRSKSSNNARNRFRGENLSPPCPQHIHMYTKVFSLCVWGWRVRHPVSYSYQQILYISWRNM